MSRADESRAGTIATAIILSPAIAAVTVVLRVCTRRLLVGVRFFEDYCIICAMVCSIAMSAFMGTCKLPSGNSCITHTRLLRRLPDAT
jgi:hypothetical protein